MAPYNKTCDLSSGIAPIFFISGWDLNTTQHDNFYNLLQSRVMSIEVRDAQCLYLNVAKILQAKPRDLPRTPIPKPKINLYHFTIVAVL
eukprot:g32624.t1